MKIIRCPYCMSDIKGDKVCPNCKKLYHNFQSEIHHLPYGFMLENRYYIGANLGEGGFGITYIGFDTKLQRKVAIKEYFPRAMVHRDHSVNYSVTCYTGSERDFEKGREQFLQEAQTLALMSDIPEIVNVIDYFAENHSAYIVMEYLEGTTLYEYVKTQGIMPIDRLLDMLEPVIKGMCSMHETGLIHRDISPDNLMIMRKTGKIKLMDFGCARDVSKKSTYTVMLKEGFAPMEQYYGHEQGPWTDIYALSATIYYCITGKKPPISYLRAGLDELIKPSNLNLPITQLQETALLKGMAVFFQNRYQSMEEFYNGLYGTKSVIFPVVINKPEKEEKKSSNEINETEYVKPVEFEESAVAGIVSSSEIGGTEYVKVSETVQKETAVGEIGETEYVVDTNNVSNVPKVDNMNETEVFEKSSSQSKEKEEKLALLWLMKLKDLSLKTKIICAVVIATVLITSGVSIYWATHEHKFGEWTVVNAAMCFNEGLEERKCFCGEIETNVIPEIGEHTKKTLKAVEPTCTEEGKEKGYYCEVCKEILKEQKVIPATGHEMGKIKKIEPTCTEEGHEAYEGCKKCGYTEKEKVVIKALGHKETAIKEVAATCTKEGSKGGFQCSRCKEILVKPETIAKIAHKEVQNKDVAATCTKEGSKGGTHCSMCNKVMSEATTIAKLAHKPVKAADVKATCTTDGQKGGTKCSVCNTVIQQGEKIAKLGHVEVKIPAVKATCSSGGKTEGSKCSRCGTIIKAQTTTAKTNHSFSNGVCKHCGCMAFTATIDSLEQDSTCVDVSYSVYPTIEAGDYWNYGSPVLFIMEVVLPNGRTQRDILNSYNASISTFHRFYTSSKGTYKITIIDEYGNRYGSTSVKAK